MCSPVQTCSDAITSLVKELLLVKRQTVKSSSCLLQGQDPRSSIIPQIEDLKNFTPEGLQCPESRLKVTKHQDAPGHKCFLIAEKIRS